MSRHGGRVMPHVYHRPGSENPWKRPKIKRPSHYSLVKFVYLFMKRAYSIWYTIVPFIP